MAQYNLTNWWIEFRYTAMSLQHVQKFQVQGITTTPQSNPEAVEMTSKDSVVRTLAEFAGDWTDALSGYFDGTQCSFDSMQMWYQGDSDFEPTFIGAVDGSHILWNQPIGTGGTKQGAQETQTYRAVDGKIIKITLMETVSAPHYRVSLSAVSATHLTPLIQYMSSGACVVKSRSGSFPLLTMNRTGVYNDALVRRRFSVD